MTRNVKQFLSGLLAFIFLISFSAWSNDRVLQQAYESKRSDIQVQGSGKVSRILPDDNKGSRHQRFILRLGTRQTILIAHNIDLAPRISNLRVGDVVKFNGEYEWNKLGGVIHWTHKDPRNNHPHGWLKHKGKQYD
ncbi:DUF3465 domain-containing protein [Aliivibrio kagoshimensis]|uniref:DUF3465 domain-containing protein n=1 Tax=Aliivibrio kagoshimensis TaxID=2910230 RepID=UPI003D10EE6D